MTEVVLAQIVDILDSVPLDSIDIHALIMRSLVSPEGLDLRYLSELIQARYCPEKEDASL